MRALLLFPLRFLPYFRYIKCKPYSQTQGGGFMLALWTKVVSWMQEEKGASMVEYALLVVLIAIVALVAVRLAGREVSSTFSEIGSGLT